ncbi:unnamed protein product [Schistocephalus solidus]|uniref:Programmed cell death protein 4 n=1 Tax=Schistocephalus solidus TaxID=70667 RepID=A0A183SV92_SCHSO|nr:unnamed protein product [Schistocephalus solidus]
MSEAEHRHTEVDDGCEGDASAEESAGEMTWPKPIFDAEATTMVVQKNPRLVKKKRMHYNSFSHAGVNGLTLATEDSAATSVVRLQNRSRVPYSKNSRKSRNGFRPEAKKLTIDHINAVLNDEDFEEFFSSLVHEYYDHCKAEEVIDALKEINLSPLQRRRLPFMAINLALQHKMSHCELTSELLSEMCGKVISMSAMQQGFHLLLDDLADIVLDVPKAPEYVGRFIARGVADDILPPKFVQQYKELHAALLPLSGSLGEKPVAGGTPPSSSIPPVPIALRRDSGGSAAFSANTHSSSGVSSAGGSVTTTTGTTAIGTDIGTVPSGDAPVNYAMQAILKAESLLTLSHAYSRLDIIWGIPPSERVTTLLMKQISSLLEEYLCTNNLEDATNALQELDAPHYHHELVYQAILLVLERSGDQVSESILRLLDHLCHSVVITLDQLLTGVKRIYVELPEIQRQLPVSYVLLERFIHSAVEVGFLPKKLANEMPTKYVSSFLCFLLARKRFVSEGDGIRKAPPVGRLF